MKKLVVLAGLAAFLSASNYAQTFTASLDAAQDGGGARSGTGTGTFTLTGASLSYSIDYSGLSSPTTVAHIHGPTPSNRPPQPTFGVLHGFTFTTGATAGNISGTWSGLTQLQIDDLNAGHMYANIHTAAFGGGEIRGQILVPEPSTYALLGAAAVAGLALRRRKA